MWTIYLIDVIENLACLSLISFIIAAFIAFISGMTLATTTWRECDTEKKMFKASSIVIIVTAFLMVFLPAKKTMYLMVGAYAVERVVETPEAKEFGSKLLKAVNSKLDEIIEKEESKSKK
jgi:Na+/melibiose symporter-like transporter